MLGEANTCYATGSYD